MKICKREGFFEPFDVEKIRRAVRKAVEEAYTLEKAEGKTFELYEPVIQNVVQKVSTFEKIDVEVLQDMIEDELLTLKHRDVARCFIKHRDKRMEIRERGWEMDELQEAIWSKKYQHEGESFSDWIERVSGGNPKVAKLIKQKKFTFAGRILAHRGLQHLGKKITFSNCYVLPEPEDNLESIFDTAGKLARTYSYGGGCGIDISKLRPKGATVNNSAKFTSGATSFMHLFDLTTDLIGQNGRRGALMISCKDSHPDLVDFIEIKTKENVITKANISIQVSDDFMKAVIEGTKWNLHWEGEDGTVIEKTVDAQEVFRLNAKNNWDWAEAGMLYWDTIKNWHLMSEHPDHSFAGVNPCAEEPLMAGGSCLLGSLNLSEFVVHPFTDKSYFDFEKFEDAVQVAVEGLNEVLDEGLELHPLKVQRDNARNWRQIGLGVMGIADMLIKLSIPYGAGESLMLSELIGHTLLNKALQTSSELAEKHGTFPMYDKDALFESKFFLENTTKHTRDLVQKHGLRNSQILTIAPTGSISTMWGISGGIEPIFATHFDRKTESLHGKDVVYRVYQPIVKEYMEVKGLKELPKGLIKTSHDIHWKDRIRMQGVWQRYIDASISSTVNLPKEVTVEDVEDLFIEAWKEGLKGVTIFRDGCKRAGILTIDSSEEQDVQDVDSATTKEEQEQEVNKITCEDCGAEIEVFSGGCSICMYCGWSPCS